MTLNKDNTVVFCNLYVCVIKGNRHSGIAFTAKGETIKIKYRDLSKIPFCPLLWHRIYSECFCLITYIFSLSLSLAAEHGEGPGHGRAGGDQSQGGAVWSEGSRPPTQKSPGGERVRAAVEGELKRLDEVQKTSPFSVWAGFIFYLEIVLSQPEPQIALFSCNYVENKKPTFIPSAIRYNAGVNTSP